MKRIIISIPFLNFWHDLITNTTSLNGTCKNIIDPYETGYYNYRFQL
jgi:hypothetical protein